MRYIKLTNDKWVEVDEENNNSRLVVRSDEIAVCGNNIQALGQNLSDLPSQVSTDGLTPEQTEAVEEKNARLEQQRLSWQQELEQFRAQLTNLEALK